MNKHFLSRRQFNALSAAVGLSLTPAGPMQALYGVRNKDKSALEILASPDDLKFRSCLTLFARAACHEADRALFEQASSQFYEGTADPHTLLALALPAR
jgi:uncharacterized protein (DUF1810 family)